MAQTQSVQLHSRATTRRGHSQCSSTSGPTTRYTDRCMRPPPCQLVSAHQQHLEGVCFGQACCLRDLLYVALQSGWRVADQCGLADEDAGQPVQGPAQELRSITPRVCHWMLCHEHGHGLLLTGTHVGDWHALTVYTTALLLPLPRPAQCAQLHITHSSQCSVGPSATG